MEVGFLKKATGILGYLNDVKNFYCGRNTFDKNSQKQNVKFSAVFSKLSAFWAFSEFFSESFLLKTAGVIP